MTTKAPTQAERARECLAKAFDDAGYAATAKETRRDAAHELTRVAVLAMLAFAEQCATDRIAVVEEAAQVAEGRDDDYFGAGEDMKINDRGENWHRESGYGIGRSDAAAAIRALLKEHNHV
jgi:hypothetical protein